MNDDDKNPDLQAWIEPELEARLVASVLGEASAFEAAELERLAGEKPELAIFKRRIEAVHGLVGLAARPEQAPLRLAPERRAKILQAIGAAAPQPTGGDTNAPVLLALAAVRRRRRQKWIWGSGIAASLLFAAILTVNLSPAYQKIARPSPEQTRLGSTGGGDKFMAASPQAESFETEKAKEETIVLSPFQVSQPSITSRLRQALTSPSPSRSAPDASVVKRSEMPRSETERREQPAAGEALDYFAKTKAESRIGDAGGRIYVAASEMDRKKDRTLGALSVPSVSNERQRGLFEEQIKASSGYGSGANGKKVFDAPAAAPKAAAKDLELGDEIVVMSPHVVEASADRGYYAANTLSGSRISSTLSDSSQFSVSEQRSGSGVRRVTKQKLADATTFDVNDNFLFGGNPPSEGSRPVAGALSPAAVDEVLSQQKAVATPPPDAPRGEISAAKEAVSTFSLHVSDVSFRLAQAALARGETPDPSRIRPEEFYNAFNYGDPSPTAADKISCRIEQAAHPQLQQRNLVRIAMKVAATGRGAGQPLHLTVLLDTSGSMEREDRIASVRRSLEVLASLLGANDRVTLIGFAREPRLLAEQLPGDQAAQLADLASRTPFTGGTNLEEALKLSGELARRHRDPAAQNRIVLITDGAANLGNADPAQLATMIESLRQQGIAFDACGVGTDGLDDSILEALTRKGDGRYYVLDKPEDTDAGFARQLAGAFRPAAENVKVQVRFNPARVGSYRLIGFEQHRLREEDFRNDKVDAAELAAEEAAVALYQVEVLPQGEGELGEVFVRFRDAGTGDMVERSWTMLHEPQARSFDRATPTLQLAGAAALLAEKLLGGDSANAIDLAELAPVVNSLRGHYAGDARVQELIAMFEQMRRREGK